MNIKKINQQHHLFRLNDTETYRIITFLHILFSIWMAHHMYNAISIHKFYLVIYITLSTQLILNYIRIHKWKDISMLTLSIILFFAVFLIKYKEQYPISLLKDIYKRQQFTKEKHANLEKHQVVYTCI